jgi:hypothetical protein
MIIGCAASDTARRLPPDVSFGTIGEQAHLERGCRCDRLKSRGKNPSPWLATVALLMVTGHLAEAPFSSTGGGCLRHGPAGCARDGRPATRKL